MISMETEKLDAILSEFRFILACLLVCILLPRLLRIGDRAAKRDVARAPISVNYHFTRECNKTCGFCFFTAKTSYRRPLEEAKRGLKLLAEAGMRKLNFAGGEPFLHPRFMGELARYCKSELKLESVSIVTNGSLVKAKWFERYGRYVDIIAVSCDSFDEQTNIEIGRGSGRNVEQLERISGWCRQYGIKFKLNTVVCRLNFQEDMTEHLARLQPFRWKCFQVLMVPGENDSEQTLRDVRKFQISSEEFDGFCAKHEHVPGFVPEPNDIMASSYLVLDEYMRFLNREQNGHSDSILNVGVGEALKQVYWDRDSFFKRQGEYDWSKDAGGSGSGNACASGVDGKNLDW